MYKFKKMSALLLAAVLTLSLSGCLGNTPETKIDLSNPDPKTNTTQNAPLPDKDNTTTEPDTEVTVPDSPEVQAEVLAVQSGEAVVYNGNILFREYHPYQMYSTGLFGKFTRNSLTWSSTGNLCTFDPKNPDKEPTVLCEDTGYGDMYLVNGDTLYSQGAREGEDYSRLNQSVYKLDLNTLKSEDICSGEICGFSPDGTHFTVYDYSLDPYMMHYRVYDTSNTGKETAHFVSGQDTIYLGMDNENMYLLNATDSSEGYYVIQVGFDGSEYYLAECNFADILGDEMSYSYPEYYDTFANTSDSISFTADFYEGTGHFYFASIDVNVSIAKGEDPSTTPIFKATLADSTKEDDPNVGFPAAIDGFEKWPGYESGRGFAKVIQYYETFDEGTFFALADSHRYPQEDVGWRECYLFINMEYCFVPAGSKEYVVIDKMYDYLGERGNLSQYDYDETMPTLYVYAGFFYDENKELVGVYYEPIEISGHAGPIQESMFFYIADIAEDFYYEYPDWSKNMEDDDFMIVTNLDEFTKEVYSWTADDYNGNNLKAAEYDYEGYLVFAPGDYSFEQFNSFMCHIGFDSEGNVNYIRPVMME